MMKKLLFLFAIIMVSCSEDSSEDITMPPTQEELAAEAAKKTSDSLVDLYGNETNASNLSEVEFLFKSNDNTYLAGKANNDLWIGAFSDSYTNIGETTVDIDQDNFEIANYQIDSFEANLLFAVHIDYARENEIDFTRLILNHNSSENTLASLSQSFEGSASDIVNSAIGFNNGYLLSTSTDLYTSGSNDLIYINQDFDNLIVWEESANCFPDDYPNLTYANEGSYFYYDEEYYFSFMNIDGCQGWEINITDIYDIEGCLNCTYSLELIDYSETEVKLKAELNGDIREVIVETSTGEIISN